MDPVRNPYAPGAGQRPPELAGRDRQLSQFEVTLERVAAGRPDRSMVLSGLRGVGKTVLLNALRGLAVQRAWGTGKLEARPDQSLRLPLAQAVHAAVREVAHRQAAQRVQQHRLADPAQSGEHHAAVGTSRRDPFEGDLELLQLAVTTGELGRALAGAGGVGVAHGIHDGTVSVNLGQTVDFASEP